ncbi:sulfurtransferase [Amycolatopsis suaedae]|uniref:Sulfurtransferase n=1 Tax=Amycolatopsis suaedae TaxID=2510978 RepID=A0A4V2EKZ2_9PSEU|nr:sulfurtransferase [Amycolatopsis suaedae]RZQ59755.1 sulfurtransferase [Amycolatopsis suaedae]
MHPLITVDELSAGPRVTLLDVRWSLTGPPGAEAFRAGHVPGARFVDTDTELAAPPGDGGRHPLPDTAVFQETLRGHGVRRGRGVVVYDQRDATVAARLWWMLRYHGVEDVRVLDGGFDAWTAAGLPVATGDEPAPEPGDVVLSPGALPLLTAGAVPGVAERGVLLDARAAERYRGESEPVDPVAGHIPGAVSAPTQANVDGSGRFLDAAALRERFAGLGVTDDTEVGVYCGSGITAAHEVLALRLAGFDAALYAGSWSEWIRDPGRPVSRGA